MKTKGFTLVELLVVIAILAILATVSVVGYTSFIAEADKTAAETDARNIEKIIEADLVIDGVCEIGTGLVAVREGNEIKFYNKASGDDKAAVTSGTIVFTHPELTQFEDATDNYTFTVSGANQITLTSTKLTDAIVITID